MSSQKAFRNQVRSMLLEIYARIGIDTPSNHQDILDFVAADVQKTADPESWHSGDVDIAFRRWIEAQGAWRRETQILVGLIDNLRLALDPTLPADE